MVGMSFFKILCTSSKYYKRLLTSETTAISLLCVTKLLFVRRCYQITNQLGNLLNEQIQAEQQAAQDYLNIAIYFLHPCVSFPGCAGFFMKMYKEELDHMQVIAEYQLLRGMTPILGSLTAPTPHKDLSLADAIKQALIMELTITEKLRKIVSVAESAEDYHCADFIISVFLTEQTRSINELLHHRTKLSRISDNKHAMYHYDLQLAKLYPYSPKYK